jgi:hypothetical protein
MVTSEFMELFAASRQRLEQATNCAQQLRSSIAAQSIILADLALPSDDDFAAKLAEASQTLSFLDRSCFSSGNYLRSLLLPVDGSKRAGCPVLKQILPDIQRQLLAICETLVDQEVLSVPITALYDLEQQLQFMQDSLEDGGSFPEAPEARQERLDRREAHNMAMMAFLGAVHRGEIEPGEE